MRELEVRLALVCYGGSSLAVYMNGISCEILKLVRASKVYHGLTADQKKDGALSYQDAAPNLAYATDTESHYFELLRHFGEHVDLRVIVDIISGTSAGGINGIFLARALAYDLDFDPLRQMWLEHGDIEELMEAETLAERGSKLFLRPVIWLFRNRIWKGQKPHPEARRKLSRFLRSRWFKPPFSGRKMLTWMIEANQNMGVANAARTLLPTNHQLDLFVSLTNFFGHKRSVHLHDPVTISEQQHRVSLKFSHRQSSSGHIETDFDDTNIAGLGFAARATSSFPGAFPPINLNDLKKHLSHNGLSWPHEPSFYQRNFGHLNESNQAIDAMYFIDGGVTNNKPFDDAINAIYDRPANREVNRRIIFVDPRPDEHQTQEGEEPTISQERPSFFQTILSALAEIPRNEPILGNLKAIEDKNLQTRKLENILGKVEAEVAELLRSIINFQTEDVTGALLSSWRREAHLEAHKRTGFGYEAYAESKRTLLVERLSQLIGDLKLEGFATKDSDLSRKLYTWANDEDRETEENLGSALSPIFQDFDVDFRVRRLRFLLKRTNQHLQANRDHAQEIRAFKKEMYDLIDLHKTRWQADFYQGLVDETSISAAMDTIAQQMTLRELDQQTDERIAKLLSNLPQNIDQQSLYRSYIGFAFYDIVTFPLTRQQDLMEIDEILVDRISPLDCSYLHQDNKSPLMGDKLFNFGAFFSRKARENDYIWGRIHAANRLVDFLIDAAGISSDIPKKTTDKLRAKLALTIANTEAQHTHKSNDLLSLIVQQNKGA